MAERDRVVFVGREAELQQLERLLEDDAAPRLMHVYGPPGVGKSALLRELARRAERQGWDAHFLEGRELAPTPDALDAALTSINRSRRPLVLIDTFERMSALAGYLRSSFLPSLPEAAVVVIAGRAAPDAFWYTGGWGGMVGELELQPLADRDSRRLLEARGVSGDTAEPIVEWAQGSPLVLGLGAETLAGDPAWRPSPGTEHPHLIRLLLRRLLAGEVAELGQELAVAALARVTTPDLLAAVLREKDASAAYARLRALSFVEPVGEGFTVHDLVRNVLRAEVRGRDPEGERELRRRIADHLYARARGGELLMAIELAHLIENPAIKWGFGWEGSIDYRLDHVREGDAAEIGEQLARRGMATWWEDSRRFFELAPERVVVVRGREDELCGYLTCMTPATAPAFADADPLLGPWLVHARASGRGGDSVLWRDAVDLTRDRRARVQAMLGMAGVLRSGTRNPRFAYLPINPTNPAAVAFGAALGAEHLADLDLRLGSRRVECHRIDYGPGGLLAAQLEVIYTELGLPSPRSQAAEIDVDVVRDALRKFRLPHRLATSPLAEGNRPHQRAESVRRLLADAVEQTFGHSESERLLKRVLIGGYLTPDQTHEQVALELSLSRAAYFRRLREAVWRVAEHLSESRVSG